MDMGPRISVGVPNIAWWIQTHRRDDNKLFNKKLFPAELLSCGSPGEDSWPFLAHTTTESHRLKFRQQQPTTWKNVTSACQLCRQDLLTLTGVYQRIKVESQTLHTYATLSLFSDHILNILLIVLTIILRMEIIPFCRQRQSSSWQKSKLALASDWLPGESCASFANQSAQREVKKNQRKR